MISIKEVGTSVYEFKVVNRERNEVDQTWSEVERFFTTLTWQEIEQAWQKAHKKPPKE